VQLVSGDRITLCERRLLFASVRDGAVEGSSLSHAETDWAT
jgi:hypothetical protein